jgi:ribonuclease P protein component
MFPQKRRINKTLFPLILKKSVFFQGQGLSLRTSKQSDRLSPPLFAVVVSAKVSSKAVKRNLLKRRVRSALESYLDKVKTGYYLIFYINNSELEDINFAKLKERVLDLIKKAKLLNE